MHSNATFLDANILLESVLQARKKATKAQRLIDNHRTVISPLSVHLLTYFGQKDGLDLDALLGIISYHNVTDFGANEVAWAKKYHENEDFEDALQVACAVMSGCKEFATLDKQLAKLYAKYIPMKLL